MLGRKQSADNAAFVAVYRDIEAHVTYARAEEKLNRTVEEVLRYASGRNAAYAWSGGKDSQALRAVMERAGINRCVMGLTNLEYPAFLQWVTDFMPGECDLRNVGLDLDWLCRNPSMLFPQDSATASKWFKLIQHEAQDWFFQTYGLEMLVLGRRRQDGNYVGGKGEHAYRNAKGITRYSPIHDWTHEEVLAVCHYFGYPLPPIYDWCNGFVVGTGAWPARQYTGCVSNGWMEVYSIDPSIVEGAAQRIKSARDYLNSL